MKQWRILLIVLGLIILLLVANFRYILQVYFDLRKSYILFHQVGGLLFFFFFAVYRFRQEDEEIALKLTLAITKKLRQLFQRKMTLFAENPKGRVIQVAVVSFFGAVVEDNEKEGDKN